MDSSSQPSLAGAAAHHERDRIRADQYPPLRIADVQTFAHVLKFCAHVGDGEDDAALADRLQRVAGDAAEADRLRRAGAARVAEFTWRRSAEETLASLRRAHAQRTAREARP